MRYTNCSDISPSPSSCDWFQVTSVPVAVDYFTKIDQVECVSWPDVTCM